MATRPQSAKTAYGLSQALLDIFPSPIISDRAPTVADRAQLGTIWIDQSSNDAYVLITVLAGVSTWVVLGGGTGSFTNVIATGHITAGTYITAGDSFTMSSGTMTVTADDNTAQVIYLHADGGTTETIDIHADQGTAVNSINIHSDVGGLTMDSGLASADAINITASDAAGGIDIDCGTGGFSLVSANGGIAIESGTGTIDIGQDATDHNVNIGGATGVSTTEISSGTGGTVLQSTGDITLDASSGGDVIIDSAGNIDISNTGTGDILINSDDTLLLDADGVLELNSSGGAINIGTDADAQPINIATGAGAARTVSIGSTTGASNVLISAGSSGGNVSLLSTGTGDIFINSNDVVLVDAGGVIDINSSGGAINIGNDADSQPINIGTGAAARTVTVGNSTGATDVSVNSGTGGITLSAAGNVDVVPVTNSVAGTSLTLNGRVGQATFTGQATAPGASTLFTITNSSITTSNAVLISASNGGTNDAQMTIYRVEQKAGSAEVRLYNNGAAGLNGDVLITFWVLN